MANKRTSTNHYEFATVDTAPGADGYFTNIMGIEKLSSDAKLLYFSVRGTGVMTVTLQFKCEGDADWSDYDTYTSAERKLIEGLVGGIQWRAGVKNGDYTSGSLRFGFDWIK